MREEVPGYYIKIHRSLTEPVLFAGVPRTFAILNGTFGAALVVGMQLYLAIPFFILSHVLAAWLCRKDKDIFEIFSRSIKYKDYYEV